jgi:hypothetical protein
MDGIWFVYLFLALFPGLIAFAAIYKYFEVRRASSWPSVPGRIVVSRSVMRDVKSIDPDSDDTETRNFADVVYEYTIAATTYRCDRVSVGENNGNFEVAETLARYPVGKAVTVYYNPNKRSEALLERELPTWLWKVATGVVLGLGGIILLAIFGFKGLSHLLAATIPNGENAPFVTACVGFALLFGLITFACQRAAAQAKRWPIASGLVEASSITSYQRRSRSSEDREVRLETLYRPNIVYGYDVGGVHYRGDKVSYSGYGTSSADVAKQVAARYPIGRALTVHYNPQNPSESAIDPSTPLGLYFFYLVPVIVLTIGYLVGRAG